MSDITNVEEDLELKAMRDVFLALKDLDIEAQTRVINYVDQRLGLRRAASGHNHQNVDAAQTDRNADTFRGVHGQEGDSSEDVSQTAEDEGALEGVSPIAKKWMRRNGLTESQLSMLYSLGVDEIDLVAKSVPGESTKERLKNVMLLQGIAAYLSGGVARIDNEKLKEATNHYDADVGGNFTSYMKSWASEIAGSRSEGNLTLTTRGLSTAKDLIKEITSNPTANS